MSSIPLLKNVTEVIGGVDYARTVGLKLLSLIVDVDGNALGLGRDESDLRRAGVRFLGGTRNCGRFLDNIVYIHLNVRLAAFVNRVLKRELGRRSLDDG